MLKRLSSGYSIARWSKKSSNFSLLSNYRNITVVHSKLSSIVEKEEAEESVRDFLPQKPILPPGWQLFHSPGSSRFDLLKLCEIRHCGEEQLHIIAFLEQKEYEKTYRMDNGEREEQEYVNFHLFLQKTERMKGGLEFSLTSVDTELAVDNLCIHRSNQKFYLAKDALTNSSFLRANAALREGENSYRGPMISELDDDLSDEILDYLDERGVNNAFAEYLMCQVSYFEQSEYLVWLDMLKKFARQ